MTTRIDDDVRALCDRMVAADAGRWAEPPDGLAEQVRRRTARRRAMSAAVVALVVAGAAVTGLALGRTGVQRVQVSAADGSGRQQLRKDPGASVLTGVWSASGVPPELVTFVGQRGGVTDAPILSAPGYVPQEVGVACLPLADGTPAGPASTACTFVVKVTRFLPSGDQNFERLCLRKVGTADTSACMSSGDLPAVPVPGTDDEMVVYERDSRITDRDVVVTGVTPNWDAYAVPSGLMSWVNCRVACGGGD